MTGAVHFCSVEVPSRDLWAASVSKGIQTRKEVLVCIGLPLSDWAMAHSNTEVCKFQIVEKLEPTSLVNVTLWHFKSYLKKCTSLLGPPL